MRGNGRKIRKNVEIRGNEKKCAETSGNAWKWVKNQEMRGMRGNAWKRVEMRGNGWKCVEMGEKSGKTWKCVEMSGNAWKWVKNQEMRGNAW